MAANTEPIFTLTPHVGAVAISTANTNRDGTGDIGTVLTAGENGTRIHRIVIKAAVTTTAGMVRLFIHDGSTYFLYKEIAVTAITASGTVAAFEYILSFYGEGAIVLPRGYSLRASTNNAEAFNVIAEGGDY